MMKQRDTLINKLEKAGAVTVIAVWILRIFLGPVLNFALLVTTTLLAIYYLWFGFFIFNKLQPLQLLYMEVRQSITPFRIIPTILMGIISSYALISVLFGFFFYPGMQFMMASALILLVVFTGVMIGIQYIKKKFDPLCPRMYIRAAGLIIILLILWAPPVEDRLNILFSDHPEFIEAYLDYRENPDDPENIQRLREQRSRFR